MSVLKILIFLPMSGALFAQGVDVVKVVSRSAERKVQLPGEFITLPDRSDPCQSYRFRRPC